MTSITEGREEELWTLLSHRVGLWTGMDHSSVTAERTQAILDALLYTLALGGEALEGEEALVAGQIPLEQLFQMGQRRIRSQLQVSKGLWRQVLDTMPVVENRCQRETLRDGMAVFFRRYESEFAANDAIITCDYPLALPVEGAEGVSLIRAYLERALRENQFCACFPPHRLRAIWTRRGVGAEDICNLFYPVFLTALGCVLLREDPLLLAPSPKGVVALQRDLLVKSRDEVERVTAGALNALVGSLGLSKIPLIRYLEAVSQQAAADLFHGTEHLCLAMTLGV